MSNLRIEIATPEMIDSLENLTKELVEGLGQKFDLKRFEWGIQRRLYDPLQRHGILIAVDEDKDNLVVGMIIAELRIDPFGSSEGYIKQVFLKDAYRGMGIGELLVRKAIEHLKKIKVEKIKVNIKEQAREASNLYSKMKFKKVYEVLELDLTD
ncbi:MAG: GNAT family N-acetyltransferase [Promethearchaeota archaeon]|nr:MAG: GNAT family N-acetyltransferase [Candidatus Lokiarchaeota archaeon]